MIKKKDEKRRRIKDSLKRWWKSKEKKKRVEEEEAWEREGISVQAPCLVLDQLEWIQRDFMGITFGFEENPLGRLEGV